MDFYPQFFKIVERGVKVVPMLGGSVSWESFHVTQIRLPRPIDVGVVVHEQRSPSRHWKRATVCGGLRILYINIDVMKCFQISFLVISRMGSFYPYPLKKLLNHSFLKQFCHPRMHSFCLVNTESASNGFVITQNWIMIYLIWCNRNEKYGNVCVGVHEVCNVRIIFIGVVYIYW